MSEPFNRALIDLCHERGFAELTVEGLCLRAGVERTEFEGRYSDLEDCFAQVYGECADQFLARVTAAFESREGWRDQLRAAAYATLLHLEEDPARATFTVVEALNAGERAQLVRERVFETLLGFIDRGRLEPDAPASVTTATAESLNGAVFQQMRVAIERHQGHRYVEVLPQLMYAVVLTYVGPEAAEEELEIRPPAAADRAAGVQMRI